jgi:SP family galactose:H+ symporter-like MFS transporter
MSSTIIGVPKKDNPPLRASPKPVLGQSMTLWLFVVLAVVLCSGGLFGYDQGVISGALHGMTEHFKLSTLMVQVVTSWMTLGALFGALAGGELADIIGRKRTVLIAGAMFTLGGLVQGFAPDTLILVAGRLVVGAGVGVAAVAAPLYASEMAPANLRGRFVSSYQLAITIGIFIAYLVASWLSKTDSWRVMLGAAAVPGLLLFAAALFTPESPRWLMKMGRRDDAAREIVKIHPGVNSKLPLDDIQVALDQEGATASWSTVFHREWRRPLLIGVGLAVFQQITGINAVIYYADQIFAAAGFISQSAQTTATTWGIGFVNVLATFIAIAFIDQIGRRKLLLVGLVGMGLSLVAVGAAFQFIGATPDKSTLPSVAGIVTLIALICFIISFAFSMGPVVWTVINEIFPANIRGRGVAVATAVNWASAYVVAQFFLSVVNAIGQSATFWLFAGFCVMSWVWVYFAVPETKGKSLEEIQAFWAEKKS